MKSHTHAAIVLALLFLGATAAPARAAERTGPPLRIAVYLKAPADGSRLKKELSKNVEKGPGKAAGGHVHVVDVDGRPTWRFRSGQAPPWGADASPFGRTIGLGLMPSMEPQRPATVGELVSQRTGRDAATRARAAKALFELDAWRRRAAEEQKR